MTPSNFIETLLPYAIASAKETNVPASFSIAQAALESAWGKSNLATVGKNLFGVKAGGSWSGDTIAIPTREYKNGQWVTEAALWRRYADWKECFDDHAKFLHGRRYSGAFTTSNALEFADAIAKAGYATDPQYAQKIKNIITTHNLLQYDKQESAPVQEPAPVIETINIEPVERRSEPQPKEEKVTSRISDETRSNAFAAVSGIASFLNPALGVAISVVPSLIRLFGSKESPITERNAQAAEAVGSMMKAVTGKDTYEGAATTLQSNPAMQAVFKERVEASMSDIIALMQAEDVSRGTAVARLTSISSSPEAAKIFSLVTKMQFALTASVIAGVVGLMAVLVYKTPDGEIPAWAVGIANALVVVVALEWRNIIHSIVGKDATIPER